MNPFTRQKNTTQSNEVMMKETFSSQVWVTDNEGRGYVCKVIGDFEKKKSLEALSEVEKATCRDVNNCSSRYSLENLHYLKFHK